MDKAGLSPVCGPLPGPRDGMSEAGHHRYRNPPSDRPSSAEGNCLNSTGHSPVTEMVTPKILSLPMFPQLATEQQARVVGEIRNSALKRTKQAATEV